MRNKGAVDFLSAVHSENRASLMHLLLDHKDTLLAPLLENSYSLFSETSKGFEFSIQRTAMGFISLWTRSNIDLVTDQLKRQLFQSVFESPFFDSVIKHISQACVEPSQWREAGVIVTQDWIPASIVDAFHQVMSLLLHSLL